MGNCTKQSSGASEQITTPGPGASATPCDHTSSFHTALEECLPSAHDVAIGGRSIEGSSMQHTSEYFSARVEEMMRSRSQFSSAIEHEIKHSKVHWSEVPGLSKLSEDSTDHEEEDIDYGEEVKRENQKVFAELMNNPQWLHHENGHFFHEWPAEWKLGQKIAEGGQGAIFEVVDVSNDRIQIDDSLLLKVFKRGTRLSDLKEQWPTRVLRQEVLSCLPFRGHMLDDGRFGFLMVRCWGDLRKLIDQAKQVKNNQGPPFPYEWKGQTLHAKLVMRKIALHMSNLHQNNIIHRDLKAANILLYVKEKEVLFFVADYECSIGVVGIGFWRAPEILLALKNRTSIDFNEKVDVYSYGMTCFEVVTGRLPFEGELEACKSSYDLVIEGQRPKLPSDLDVPLKALIERCWNPIPSERPSFEEILEVLRTL